MMPARSELQRMKADDVYKALQQKPEERSEAAILKILDHFAHIPGVRKYLDRTAYKVPNPRKASLHLGRSLTLLTLSPGTLVYYQREIADTDAMYVILSGRAEILHSTHHMHRLLAQKELKYTKGAKHASSTKELKPALGNAGAMLGSREGIMGTSIGMLTPGMCFGETLREDRKRQYTVVALGSTSGRPTELVRMSIKAYSKCCPVWFENINNAVDFRTTQLMQLHLFADWDVEDLRFLARWMQEVQWEEGDVVYEPDDPVQYVYFMVVGSVGLSLPAGVTEGDHTDKQEEMLEGINLEVVEPPGFFGEAEILRDMPGRLVAAVANEDSRGLAVPAEIFKKLLTPSMPGQVLASAAKLQAYLASRDAWHASRVQAAKTRQKKLVMQELPFTFMAPFQATVLVCPKCGQKGHEVADCKGLPKRKEPELVVSNRLLPERTDKSPVSLGDRGRGRKLGRLTSFCMHDGTDVLHSEDTKQARVAAAQHATDVARALIKLRRKRAKRRRREAEREAARLQEEEYRKEMLAAEAAAREEGVTPTSQVEVVGDDAAAANGDATASAGAGTSGQAGAGRPSSTASEFDIGKLTVKINVTVPTRPRRLSHISGGTTSRTSRTSPLTTSRTDTRSSPPPAPSMIAAYRPEAAVSPPIIPRSRRSPLLDGSDSDASSSIGERSSPNGQRWQLQQQQRQRRRRRRDNDDHGRGDGTAGVPPPPKKFYAGRFDSSSDDDGKDEEVTATARTGGSEVTVYSPSSLYNAKASTSTDVGSAKDRVALIYGGGAATVRVLDEETGLERETSNSLAAYSDETRQELQSAQVNVMVVLKALRKFKKLLKQRRERKAKLIRSMSGKGDGLLKSSLRIATDLPGGEGPEMESPVAGMLTPVSGQLRRRTSSTTFFERGRDASHVLPKHNYRGPGFTPVRVSSTARLRPTNSTQSMGDHYHHQKHDKRRLSSSKSALVLGAAASARVAASLGLGGASSSSSSSLGGWRRMGPASLSPPQGQMRLPELLEEGEGVDSGIGADDAMASPPRSRSPDPDVRRAAVSFRSAAALQGVSETRRQVVAGLSPVRPLGVLKPTARYSPAAAGSPAGGAGEGAGAGAGAGAGVEGATASRLARWDAAQSQRTSASANVLVRHRSRLQLSGDGDEGVSPSGAAIASPGFTGGAAGGGPALSPPRQLPQLSPAERKRIMGWQ